MQEKIIIKILFLFVLSRIALCTIGYLAQKEFAIYNFSIQRHPSHSNPILKIWARNDSGYYLDIAENGYPKLNASNANEKHAQYSFFPLYPFLIYVVATLPLIDFFDAGLLISNISLILLAYYLYKLSQIYYGNNVAEASLYVLFASPVSFILSGIFSEALFICVVVVSLYHAANRKWFFAGITAMLAILCRPVGVFIFIPLSVIFLKSFKSWKYAINPKLIFLTFIPLGVFILMAVNYYYTKDAFMFLHNPGYPGTMQNPLLSIYKGLADSFFTFHFLATYTCVTIALWIIFYKHITLAHHLLIASFVLIPLSFGLMSMPRMILAAFPFYILVAAVCCKYKMTTPILVTLSILQGFLFTCWVLGLGNII
jgi:hypothetical protein